MKTDEIINLSFNFLSKFLLQHIKYMLKYILIGGLGFIFVFLAFIEPIFAFFALFITIPAFCYAFWKGFVATYAINLAAYDFINARPIKKYDFYIETIKQNEAVLAGFVSFIALVTLLAYIPGMINFIQNLSIEELMLNPTDIKISKESMVYFIAGTVLTAPFINFSLQAFFFRKKENFISLFVNCYKNTGLLGFIISNIIVGFVGFISFKAPVIYFLLFMPLNILIYSFNLFFYFNRIKKTLR